MGELRIFSFIALFLGLSYPIAAAAQSNLQTFVSVRPQAAAIIAENLASQMTDDVNITQQNETYEFSYAGQHLPQSFREFLIAEFDGLDPTEFAVGETVNISLALVPSNSGTQIRLMTMVQRSLVPALPSGAEVLLSDGAISSCSGQLVLSHDGSVKENTAVYVPWAQAAGFDLTDASDANLSFYIGHQATCSIFMYIQPDPEAHERSMVVVRYVED